MTQQRQSLLPRSREPELRPAAGRNPGDPLDGAHRRAPGPGQRHRLPRQDRARLRIDAASQQITVTVDSAVVLTDTDAVSASLRSATVTGDTACVAGFRLHALNVEGAVGVEK